MHDDSHDPSLRSWVASANDDATDFPIQNLPFGRFRRIGSDDALRIGVAIGDQVLDLQLAVASVALGRRPRRTAAPAGRRRPERLHGAGQRRPSRGPATCCPRRCAQAVNTPPSSSSAWCRRPRSSSRCRARSATTPTSTPASTMRRAVGKLFRPDDAAAAELQVGADRLPRPVVVDRASAATTSAGLPGSSRARPRRRRSAHAAGSTTSSSSAP